MQRITTLLIFFFAFVISYSQVGINTTTPSPASVLDIESSSDGINFGGFMIPRVNLTQRNAIPASASDDGLMVFLQEGNTRCIQIWDGALLTWANVYCMPVNQAPIATSVGVSGSSFDVGISLTATYTYQDSEGDPEGSSTYQWYQANDALGTNSTIISGATSLNYVPQVSDIGKYIAFSVIPIATTGTLLGVEAFSSYVGPIDSNDAPVASNVVFQGCEIVGETLTGYYVYSDAENDAEGITTFQWYTATDALGSGATPIVGATNATYTVQASDVGNYIGFEVTPVATNGTLTGIPVSSNFEGPVVSSGSCVPILLGIQDFESPPGAPTFPYVENSPGTLETGVGSFPSSNKFVSPVTGYGISNGTADIDLGPIDASSYFSATASFHLASFSGTSGNGADLGDTVFISISTDGGVSFSDEILIQGNSNRRWDFNATGTANSNYDGDNSATVFTSPNGSTGIANVTISGIPNASNLVIKIIMLNNSANELWVIDDVEIYGNP